MQDDVYEVFQVTVTGTGSDNGTFELATDYNSIAPQDYYFVVNDGSGNPLIDLMGSDYLFPGQQNNGNDYFIVLSNFPLPLQLLAFEATKRNNTIITNWETIDETNLSHYQLQRSTAQTPFQDIASLPAQGGSFQQSYSYTDKNVLPNTTYYYRLKMVDNDGQFEYSPIRSARIAGDTPIKIYPNPASNELNVEVHANAEGPATFEVRNHAGGKIYLQELELLEGTNTLPIHLEGWPAGVYFIKVKTEAGTTTEKFLKTN
ncbi:MAG: T9SS type A sorting domain-containing protein [Lewinellaceae bacterium]|nr:T9SS type A sorting domain-containing protein [Saprospiraceae bacterium]MCB9339788.1 T9SS type A sorting domain-containing protein [Lewinellaceae bacterium]